MSDFWKSMVLFIVICIGVLLIIGMILASTASAYYITGGDSQGRYATVHNVVNAYPGIARAVPSNMEVRLLHWGYPGAKAMLLPDGHIRIDIDGTAYNPEFSRLMAHELGHALQLARPYLGTAWLQLLRDRGYPDSVWRWPPGPVYSWWYWNPWEAWAENFCRALYWPYYSPRATPSTYLVWLSRVDTWAFLNSVGISRF